MSATPLRPLSRRAVLQATLALPAIAAIAPVARASSLSLQSARQQRQLVAGNTEFAFTLYHALRESADNLFFSPYSVSLALAMTYAGAQGDTADQMADVLAFDVDQEEVGPALGALTTGLLERGNGEGDPDAGEAPRGLRIANALWGERTVPFNPDYTDQLEDDYGAGLEEVDFIGSPKEARDEINDWVADQTEGHIEDIVPPNAITEATRLVLANAIWFSAAWATPFDPENTEDADFTLLDGDTVTVPFMAQRDFFPYASADGFQVVELPFGGESGESGFAFTVILPDKDAFEDVEESLDADALADVLDQLESTEIQFHAPKFTLEYDASLAEPLQDLGMTDAFDPDRADFGGMVDGDDDPLVIGDVLHKAFVTVDESGAEAAAATVVEMVSAAEEVPEEPIELRLDRPFLFAIRDTETGTLLFLGRVMDPGA